MSYCTTYTTSQARRERCEAIGLCANCSSSKHPSHLCPAQRFGLDRPCGICRNKSHINALCPSDDGNTSGRSSGFPLAPPAPTGGTSVVDLCINNRASESGNILPTMTLRARVGDKTASIRVLVDSGSQSSYISDGVLRKLGIDSDSLPIHRGNVKTFLGEREKTFRYVDLELGINRDSFRRFPLFVDPDLDVSFEVKGLIGAMFSLKRLGFNLADTFYVGNHTDYAGGIQGLIGVDILSCMRPCRVVQCYNGSAYETCFGYIPFGPVKTFLPPSQYEVIFGSKPDSTPAQCRSSSDSSL